MLTDNVGFCLLLPLILSVLLCEGPGSADVTLPVDKFALEE